MRFTTWVSVIVANSCVAACGDFSSSPPVSSRPHPVSNSVYAATSPYRLFDVRTFREPSRVDFTPQLTVLPVVDAFLVGFGVRVQLADGTDVPAGVRLFGRQLQSNGRLGKEYTFQHSSFTPQFSLRLDDTQTALMGLRLELVNSHVVTVQFQRARLTWDGVTYDKPKTVGDETLATRYVSLPPGYLMTGLAIAIDSGGVDARVSGVELVTGRFQKED